MTKQSILFPDASLYSISQACRDFKPKFLEYIKTGELPEGFACEADLQTYINRFTYYERNSIKNTCLHNLFRQDDFQNLTPVFRALPQVALEVIAGIGVSAAITYRYTNDINTTLRNSTIAAGAGILWACGRFNMAQKSVRNTEEIYKNRIKKCISQ